MFLGLVTPGLQFRYFPYTDSVSNTALRDPELSPAIHVLLHPESVACLADLSACTGCSVALREISSVREQSSVTSTNDWSGVGAVLPELSHSVPG